jgi:hypothetical protein
MQAVLFDWPYLGLALAAASLAWLAFERRPAGAPPRLRDPAFVLGLMAPLYLLHQFEEHGVDLRGQHYAFLGELCAVLGVGPGATDCPADPGFIFAVNPVAVWLAAGLALAFRRTRPRVAACAWGIPLVNAATHIGSAVAHARYNPGLLTSLVLFVPLGAWMLHTCLRAGVLARRDVPRVLAAGVVVHAVLVGSLLARMHGLPYAVLLAVNGLNGFTPWLLGGPGRPAPEPQGATSP